MESYPSTSNALSPSIDLSSYHATGEGLENGPGTLDYTPVERSGDTVLLQFPPADQGWLWAVADTATHRLTRLKLPFQTTNDSVHLGPGGKAIYLQMTQLERPSGSLLISRNGSRWKPSLGLGVWPTVSRHSR